MLQRIFYAIASRLRPDLASMSGPDLIGSLLDIAAVLYLLPFAFIGIGWLTAVTDLQLLIGQWPLFLAATAVALGFKRMDFTLQLEVRPGVFALVTGSFERLIYWSMALTVGPTFLWIAALTALIDFIWNRGTSAGLIWYRLRELVTDLVVPLLTGLLALKLYAWLDGPIPLQGSFTALALPVIAATSMWLLFSRLLIVPLLLYASRSPELVGSGSLTDQASLTRFLLVGSLVSGIADPFAVLGAVLYSEIGGGAYFAFTAGALLATYLANRLSHSVARGEQRNREMTIIEGLGRAFMSGPAAITVLRTVLEEEVGGLFMSSHIEIRLFPEEILYTHLPDDFTVDPAVWERLNQDDPGQFEIREIELPGSSSRWTGLAASIRSMEDDQAVGGIFLMWQPGGRRYADYMPALFSLAEQIASALRRIELLREALDEQADAYQQEVYAQAYQAQVYAQALALEKMTQELVVAGQIQASFLPAELPDVPGWQMAVSLEPAREASGDFYDLIELPNGRLGLVIADVADKGMGAALYMALSRTLIRTYALEHDSSPERALSAANHRILADTTTDLFVTVFYAILDTDTGRMSYCNAGHNPPYLLRGKREEPPFGLKRTALPLGIMEESSWESCEVQLEPGDVLAMYTDGVTEAQDEDEEFFGEERLLQILQANVKRSAEVIEEKVVTAVYDFAGDAPQFDDITMMVVARR